MTFLCLAYEEEAALNALDADAWDALRRETLAYVDSLRARGTLIDARPLRSARTAATVRVRGGALSVTDGPFAETKEQIGGFFLIHAADVDEAVRIASAWPSARLGTIEVRPVEDALPLDARYP